MKKTRTVLTMLLAVAFIAGISSCKKYRKYDDGEVVENTFSGNVDVTSTGSNPAGDFTGEGDTGTYSFVWDNSSDIAELNYDITTSAGSVTFVLKDAKGDEVLNQTRTAGGDDTFSGRSEEGKAGKWLVEITLTDFDGDGSYSLTPIN
jgi:hypothetical protein